MKKTTPAIEPAKPARVPRKIKKIASKKAGYKIR